VIHWYVVESRNKANRKINKINIVYKMKIAIETLDVKLNQAETEALQRQFVRAGFEPVTASG